ncbi:hypothetical protein [Flavobacterium panacagri]|uniref:hypothetical protein n=1 Tax=Flavobacterium panacagri TaxID=3034146 RepID=UPI0025A667B1|nr:hypothetical protein [Flavobacterium panacagri]
MNFNPNYQFEIDPKIKETYRNAEKIFGSDPKTIRKISKRVLIFGILVMIISIKALIGLLFAFRINLFTLVFALGAFLVYSSFYLRQNILKFPILIVYKDEILFKRQKYFGKLKLLNLYRFYTSNEFESLDRDDLKNVVIPKGVFNTAELCLETSLKEPQVFLMLNVEKEYLNHIALYLNDYIKNKS